MVKQRKLSAWKEIYIFIDRNPIVEIILSIDKISGDRYGQTKKTEHVEGNTYFSLTEIYILLAEIQDRNCVAGQRKLSMGKEIYIFIQGNIYFSLTEIHDRIYGNHNIYHYKWR